MVFVAIEASSGMGNQLFMIAAVLGYAELWGHEPVFWCEPQSSWEHLGSQFRIRDAFPHIRVLSEEERTQPCTILREPANAVFTYNPLPYVEENVKLVGYFQSDLYGPSTFPTIRYKYSLYAPYICETWRRTFFLHVRRGDFLHKENAHHAVDLREFWKKAMTFMRGDTCFVVSDDMPWCRKELMAIVGDTWKGEWRWCPEDMTDTETFFWLTACDAGGITANSTFSWWAAWYIQRRVGSTARICMPANWGTAPLPPTRHLHPRWAIVV